MESRRPRHRSFDFPDWQSDHRRGCALGFDDEEHIVEFLNMNVAIPRGLDINEENTNSLWSVVSHSTLGDDLTRPIRSQH